MCFLLVSWASVALAASDIPKAAWSRPIGLPLENPGVTKDPGMIDDGYWQGAPGRRIRRRHLFPHLSRRLRPLAHQGRRPQIRNRLCQSIRHVSEVRRRCRGNGASPDDRPSQERRAGAAGHGIIPWAPETTLRFIPKSWYDYQWDKFPAHVVLEQFSPVLPDNYRESSYPVAVYRWHAENPTNKAVTVSVLLSWANMAGWFRTFTADFNGAPNQGNYNQFVSEPLGAAGHHEGNRLRPRPAMAAALNEWDGQFAIAALETPRRGSHLPDTFRARATARRSGRPSPKTDAWPTDDTSWVSDSEKLAGAIAVRFTLQPGEKKDHPHGHLVGSSRRAIWSGRKWNRRYTDFYGTTGNNAWKIARDGLLNAGDLERRHRRVAGALRQG